MPDHPRPPQGAFPRAPAAVAVMIGLLVAAVPAEARGGRWQGARDVIPAYQPV
jgi:hypothetical protein